ncbi:hypothetical protein PIB30_059855 [Stylosanthes scabra]|uniref:Uncharacterized protein n=1 Tax=Stylosanthes scabra TaxID=79078 RepID=A0ABU6ZJ31_9FABA|nr:hypothetical protein [Stylosanthes scabra]
MELLVKTRDVTRSEGGPSSSRVGRVGAIAAPPLQMASPEVSMELDSDSDDGSDGEYMGESEESNESFDEAEYIAETHQVRSFLLPIPTAIPDLPPTLHECGKESFKTEVPQLYRVLKSRLPNKWDQRLRQGIKKAHRLGRSTLSLYMYKTISLITNPFSKYNNYFS